MRSWRGAWPRWPQQLRSQAHQGGAQVCGGYVARQRLLENGPDGVRTMAVRGADRAEAPYSILAPDASTMPFHCTYSLFSSAPNWVGDRACGSAPWAWMAAFMSGVASSLLTSLLMAVTTGAG